MLKTRGARKEQLQALSNLGSDLGIDLSALCGLPVGRAPLPFATVTMAGRSSLSPMV
jgi:hypothetical protein